MLDSRSERFQIGDAVLSLPSAYFKSHVAAQAEWFEPEVHGVLLESMPVRGGFSELFSSHELYSYKISECVPRMLLAQGLGTVLCMLRRLQSSWMGKTVVVLGQGQNGLLATQLLLPQARHVLCVEPLAHRRAAAERLGAVAVAPAEAQEALAARAPRGADLVLEMVGHQQHTINEALELVRSGGTVVAFGVPDEPVASREETSK